MKIFKKNISKFTSLEHTNVKLCTVLCRNIPISKCTVIGHWIVRELFDMNKYIPIPSIIRQLVKEAFAVNVLWVLENLLNTRNLAIWCLQINILILQVVIIFIQQVNISFKFEMRIRLRSFGIKNSC